MTESTHHLSSNLKLALQAISGAATLDAEDPYWLLLYECHRELFILQGDELGFAEFCSKLRSAQQQTRNFVCFCETLCARISSVIRSKQQPKQIIYDQLSGCLHFLSLILLWWHRANDLFEVEMPRVRDSNERFDFVTGDIGHVNCHT